MADQDVESVEAKKLRNANIERMARRWREEVPFPRAHLEHVTAEGDAGVWTTFYARENTHRDPRPPFASWMAMMDMSEIHRAIKASSAQQRTLT